MIAALLQVVAQEANRMKWAPAFRSLTSQGEYTRVSTNIAKPSGVVSGDKLIAGISIAASAPYDPPVTPPAGWTLLVKNTHTDGSWVSHTHWFWKDAGSSEPSSYTFTHSNGTGSNVLFAVSGAPPGAPTFTSQNGTGTTATALSVTTVRNNQLVAFISDNWNAPGGTLSAPAGTTPTFTEQLDAASQYVYLATGVLATPGATGAKSHTTTNGASDAWSALLIAF